MQQVQARKYTDLLLQYCDVSGFRPLQPSWLLKKKLLLCRSASYLIKPTPFQIKDCDWPDLSQERWTSFWMGGRPEQPANLNKAEPNDFGFHAESKQSRDFSHREIIFQSILIYIESGVMDRYVRYKISLLTIAIRRSCLQVGPTGEHFQKTSDEQNTHSMHAFCTEWSTLHEQVWHSSCGGSLCAFHLQNQ